MNAPVRSRGGLRPLRAAFVIDSLAGLAGTENQLGLVVERLDRRCIEPTWVTLRGEPSPGGERGVPVHRCPIDRLVSLDALEIRRLAAWLDESGIDVVVTFFHDAAIVGTLAAHLARVPVIGSRRNLGYWERGIDRLVLRAIRPLTARWIANSAAARDRAVQREGIDPSRIEVIHNGIDLRRFTPASDADRREARRALGVEGRSLVIGCVANLRPVKDHATLLEAFRLARPRLPDGSVLVLVGDGPSRESLERTADEPGLAGSVVFAGARRDVSSRLGAFDVGVLASRSESFPNAVLEYMAAGLAAVAPDVGGVPELIDDGRTGRIVAPRDPAALAAAIVELGGSAARREALGREARAEVSRRFRLETIVDRWTHELASVAAVAA